MGKLRKGNILYVLDEPTTGLSLYDTFKLMEVLKQLFVNANSVVIVEHDVTILSYCHWIIELGTDGGIDGGNIISQGKPEDLSNYDNSKIGVYIDQVIGDNKVRNS